MPPHLRESPVNPCDYDSLSHMAREDSAIAEHPDDCQRDPQHTMHSNGYQFEGPHPVYSGDIVPIIQELHKDLASKWRQHEQIVRVIWQELGRSKREDILKGSITGGLILKDHEDDAFGDMCFIVPEWNLHELAEPNSDLLLDLIHHRASTWLSDQYVFGPNNGLGNEGFILELIHQSNTTYE